MRPASTGQSTNFPPAKKQTWARGDTTQVEITGTCTL